MELLLSSSYNTILRLLLVCNCAFFWIWKLLVSKVLLKSSLIFRPQVMHFCLGDRSLSFDEVVSFYSSFCFLDCTFPLTFWLFLHTSCKNGLLMSSTRSCSSCGATSLRRLFRLSRYRAVLGSMVFVLHLRVKHLIRVVLVANDCLLDLAVLAMLEPRFLENFLGSLSSFWPVDCFFLKIFKHT